MLREIKRKLTMVVSQPPGAIAHLNSLLERAERIRQQQPKNKLSALPAPDVECIGKGNARKPYEFGVKASLAVIHKSGPMVGARTFLGNPYDGHILSAAEPAIGHLKSDRRVDRCWLQGQLGDALHAVLCATGYSLRWLLRAMIRLGLKAGFFAPRFPDADAAH